MPFCRSEDRLLRTCGADAEDKEKARVGLHRRGRVTPNATALAGGDSSGSRAGDIARTDTAAVPGEPIAKAAQGERETGPQPGAARVRFEFAGRAHQRKITPELRINLALQTCQEESDDFGKKVWKKWRVTDCGSAIGVEQHVRGLHSLALTVIEVEDKVVLGDIVARRKAESLGGLIDGRTGAL